MNKAYDLVIGITGPGIGYNHVQSLKNIFGSKVHLFGDGKQPLYNSTTEEYLFEGKLAQLKNLYPESFNKSHAVLVHFDAHGIMWNSKHCVRVGDTLEGAVLAKTKNIFTTLSKYFTAPFDLFYESCYAGGAEEDLDELPSGSSVLLTSGASNVTMPTTVGRALEKLSLKSNDKVSILDLFLSYTFSVEEEPGFSFFYKGMKIQPTQLFMNNVAYKLDEKKKLAIEGYKNQFCYNEPCLVKFDNAISDYEKSYGKLLNNKIEYFDKSPFSIEEGEEDHCTSLNNTNLSKDYFKNYCPTVLVELRDCVNKILVQNACPLLLQYNSDIDGESYYKMFIEDDEEDDEEEEGDDMVLSIATFVMELLPFIRKAIESKDESCLLSKFFVINEELITTLEKTAHHNGYSSVIHTILYGLDNNIFTPQEISGLES